MSLSGQVSGTETATLGGALIPKVAHAHPGFGHAPILIKVCFWGDLQALPLPQRMISMRMMWMTRMSTRGGGGGGVAGPVISRAARERVSALPYTAACCIPVLRPSP